MFLKIGAANHQIWSAVTSYLFLKKNYIGPWGQQSLGATESGGNRFGGNRVWGQQSLGATESGGNRFGGNSVNHANGRRVTSSHVLRTGRSEHVCFGVKNANGSRVTHVFENRGSGQPDLERASRLPVP